jgi:hypothetical protein
MRKKREEKITIQWANELNKIAEKAGQLRAPLQKIWYNVGDIMDKEEDFETRRLLLDWFKTLRSAYEHLSLAMINLKNLSDRMRNKEL